MLVKQLRVPGSFWFSYQSKQLEEYRKKAEYTTSFNEMNNLYHSRLEQERITEYFAIACRNYSRIIRKGTNCIINMRLFWGNNFETFELIKLESVDAIYLSDIVTTFNTVHSKFFINRNEEKTKKFINQLLENLLKKVKSNPEREVSYLLKALRCAQIYNSPLYEKYLQALSNKLSSLNLFDCISFLNVIMRGKMDFDINELEKKHLESTIRTVQKNNWIQISSMPNYIDLINPIADFYMNMPYPLKNNTIYISLWSSLNDYLTKNHKKLGSEEIIRIFKVLDRVKFHSNTVVSILKSIFALIKENGETVIEPVFIIRLIAFHQNALLLDEIDNAWQKKLISLVEFYFKQNQLSTRSIMQCLTQLTQAGLLHDQETLKMMRLACELSTSFRSENLTLYFQNLVNIFFLHMQFAPEKIVFAIEQVYKEFLAKIKEDYFFFFVFVEEITDFLRQLGVPTTIKRRKIANNKVQAGSDSRESSFGYLSKLHSSVLEVSTTTKNLNMLNMLMLKAAIRSLKYTHNFEYFLSILYFPSFNVSVATVIANEMLDLAIPRQYHSKITNFLLIFFKSQSSLVLFIYNELRQLKNSNKRSSQLQAEYFMNLLRKVPADQRLSYYSDRVIQSFLLIFQRDEFFSDVFAMIEAKQINISKFQYLLFSSLAFLSINIDDTDEIKRLGNQALSYSLQIPQAQNFILEILEENGQRQATKDQSISPSDNLKNISVQVLSLEEFNSQSAMKLLEAYVSKLKITVEEGRFQNEIIKNLMKIIKLVLKKQPKKLSSQGELYPLKPLLVKLGSHVECDRVLSLKVFMLAVSLKWETSQLFQRAIRIARIEKQWKNYIKAEELLVSLAECAKSSEQVRSAFPIIINLLRYNQSYLLPIVTRFGNSHEQILKSEPMWRYFTYYKTFIPHSTRSEDKMR